MTPRDLIDRKNRSPNVAYHKFVLISNKLGTSVLYCFFEGKEDSPYYLSRISPHFDSCEPIICYGKANVIALFSKITAISKYKSYKIKYFMDRDFGPPVNIGQIYETPTYSIENLYCSASCFANILKHEFQVTIDDPTFQACMSFFTERQKEFHESVTLFNAWYYTVKENAGGPNVKLGVCLEDVLPKGFVLFDFSAGITQSYTFDDIKSLFPEAVHVSKTKVMINKKKMSECDKAKVFRGKYELEFLKKCLRYLISDANIKTSRKYLKQKTRFNFQDDLLLSQLSQYADTPACLAKYIAV